MKKIVFLGSSVAAAKAIEEIRHSDQETDISLIAFDGQYPYNRNIFTGLMAQEVAPDDIYYHSREFYEQKRVNVILDQKITRINFKKNKIFTEDKTQVDYDTLIIADSPETKLPDIKGINKNGVYGLKKYKDADQIFNTIPLIDTAVIQSDTFLGLQAAMALGKRGKEVLLVTSGHLLASIFDEGSSGKISRLCEEKGVRVIANNTIAEVLGDADAKAIRLKSGKVLATQMIIFTETREDLRLFSDATLELNNKIPVNANFRTKLENVYAIDHVCGSKEPNIDMEDYPSLSALEAQGKSVAASIKGEELNMSYLDPVISVAYDDFQMHLIGQIKGGEGINETQRFEDEGRVYKKFFIQGESLIGTVLVNASNDVGRVQQWIQGKIPVNEIGEYLNPPTAEAVSADEGESSMQSAEETGQIQGGSGSNS